MKQFFLITLIIFSLSSFANVISSFTCNNIKGCSPLVVNMTDHSTGNIASRHWIFGNGNTSTQTDPSATFLTPGIYMVKLIVSDGANTDTSFKLITVFNPPVANFNSDKTTVCPGDSIHFINQATAGSAPVNQYAWGFGNGVASSDTNAIYRYPQSGTYDVTLVVQDTNGCNAHMTKAAYITVWPKPTASFTASPILSCGSAQPVSFTNLSTGNSLTYNWSFGDSTSGTSASPSHAYSYGKYTAHLLVSNNYGCVDSMNENISIIYLQADFIASKTTVCAGEAVTFLNRSPMLGGSWHWNFGDGTTSTRQNPVKVYTQPGIYSVTFIVSDGNCRDSATKVAYIHVTAGFSVGFAADTLSSCSTPFVVNFTSHVPSGVSLTWSFGDGHTSNSADPSNTYNGSALYTVTLTAVDSLGCTVVASAPNYINTSRPSTRFISDSLFCPGSHVLFTNKTQNGVKYLWNFGDGDTSTQVSPNHTYSNYGQYTVSLTAWDSIGCDSTYTRASYIRVDSTEIGFDVDEKFSLCPPLVSIFSSHASRPDLKYVWDFGDGYTDTTANPTHIYFHPGVYTVKLMGYHNNCSSTVIDSNLIVVQGPSGTFTMNPNTGCIPVDVTFSAHPSANTQTVICDLGDGTLYTDSLNFSYTYNAVNIFHPKFILTDQIGCSVPYSLDSITTHAVPAISIHDTSICAGKNVSINLPSAIYQWKSRSTQVCDTCGTTLNICDTCDVVMLQPSDTTIYTVTETNGFGCAASGHFQVNVAALPILTSQDTIKLCKDATVQMNVVKQAYSVTWTPDTYLSSASAFAPTCTPASSLDYIVTASNRLGCIATQIVPVRVYDTIPLQITPDTAVCAGSSVQLNAFVTDTFFHGVNYSWKRSSYLNNTDIADPIATVQSQSETFQVTASSGSCPIVVANVTVGVNPSANVKLPANIITSPFVELSITPVSGDLTTYSWSAKNDLTCAQCATTTLVPTESQMVILHGANQFGCTTSDSMLIHVVNCDPASIFVPNTFTPNGDGTNDRLYVRSKTLAQLEYFQLFNRWGAMVFQTKNVSEGWDGMINGKLAEEGVYVYQVSGKCENGYDVSTSGTVTLIR